MFNAFGQDFETEAAFVLEAAKFVHGAFEDTVGSEAGAIHGDCAERVHSSASKLSSTWAQRRRRNAARVISAARVCSSVSLGGEVFCMLRRVR